MVNLNNDYQLVITYRHRDPIELEDFTEALKSLAYDYRKHLKKQGLRHDIDSKLYVKKIQEGSIEIILAAVTPIISDINTVVSFFLTVKAGFDWLSGKISNNPGLDKQDVITKQNVVSPVVKDQAANLEAKIINNQGNIFNNCVVSYNYDEAVEIDRKAEAVIESMAAMDGKMLNNTLLAIHQASKSSAGFKGIVQTVSKKPKKLTFNTPELKQQILEAEENMFRKAYVVNLRVEYQNDRVVLYNLLEIKEIFNFDEIDDD